MDLNPAIRAPQTARFSGNYTDYLKSPTWRTRRNARLKVAGWRCERCQAKRDLQVHHKTYVRLGSELDADLEVLCKACHEGHHIAEDARLNISLYIKLAGEVLRTACQSELTYPDFVDLVKKRCAECKLPYNTAKLTRAVDIALKRRPGIQAPPGIREQLEAGEWVGPPSALEAASILKQLGIKVGLRTMPPEKLISRAKADQARAFDQVMRLIEEQSEKCDALELQVHDEKADRRAGSPQPRTRQAGQEKPLPDLFSSCGSQSGLCPNWLRGDLLLPRVCDRRGGERRI